MSLAVGILIMAQWRSLPDRVTNPIAPYASLKETKEALYTDQNELKGEIADLQKAIAKAQQDGEDVSLTKDEIAELNGQKAQAGLTKLSGPGIIIIYNDSQSDLVTEDSVVHAADLRDTVNLLWGSGAEAISINGQRVVINTAIDCIVNTILVNNTRISNPFQIEAIGNPDRMYDRLADPTALTQIHDRKKNQGLIFNANKNDNITIMPYDGSFDIKTGTQS